MLDRLGSSHLKIGRCADMWTQSQVSTHPLGNTATSFPGFYNHTIPMEQERQVGERIWDQGWEIHLYNGMA